MIHQRSRTRDIKMNMFFCPSKIHQKKHVEIASIKCIKNFSSIEITSKIVLRNCFDLNPIKIMTKNVRWNAFLSIKTTLKKVRQNDVDLLLIEITSKKCVEMTRKFISILFSLYRPNIEIESTLIQHVASVC